MSGSVLISYKTQIIKSSVNSYFRIFIYLFLGGTGEKTEKLGERAVRKRSQ